MEGILNLARFSNFETVPASIGIKIVTPISGAEKITGKLFSTGKRNSYTLMPETVPFCAQPGRICNRVFITSTGEIINVWNYYLNAKNVRFYER